MEAFLENSLSYLIAILFLFAVIFYYLRTNKKNSKKVIKKIEKAKELGLYEPISLHPVINYDQCIGSGACVKACPEKDILGIVSGKGATINASRCVGHGACFHACPVHAITLVIGTEKRGVDLPHLSQEFETNVPGIYIAGELGGMGLIKNAVEQGKQAVINISKVLRKNSSAEFDLVIVGAGPAGISAALESCEKNLKFVIVDQDTLGGTVSKFPRKKIVMTSPMFLPKFGKLKLTETSKKDLINIWTKVLIDNNIKINEQEKVLDIVKNNNEFIVKTDKKEYYTQKVLLAIGRRGTPRKLNIKGEENEKVFYKLIEPELITNQNVLIIGGGDSAIEAALSLFEGNKVYLSYRGESFSRIKQKNLELINEAVQKEKIKVIFNSTIIEIKDNSVEISVKGANSYTLDNDLIYIFAGGELPIPFLEKIGIKITQKFGEEILKHN